MENKKLESLKDEFYLLHVNFDYLKRDLLEKKACCLEFEELAYFLKVELNNLCKKAQKLKLNDVLDKVNFFDTFDLYQDLIILSNENFDRKKEKSRFFNCINKNSKIKTLNYYNEIVKIENNKKLFNSIKSIYKNDIDFFIHLVGIEELKTQLFFQHVFKYSYNFKTILYHMIDNSNVKDKVKLKLKISEFLDRQFHEICFYKINKLGVNI